MNRSHDRLSKLVIGAALLASSTPALAHVDPGLAGGFFAGLTHPFFGPDHLLAMVAVGLWGAFLGRPLLVLLPVIFPTVMAFGGVLGMVAAPMLPVELGIALSLIVLGGAIALAWRAPIWLASAIVALFAIFHGYAHGTELPSIADPIAFSLGFVLTTGLLHLAGIGIGLLYNKPGGVPVLRGLGGLIALSGVYFLVQATALLA